MTPNIYIEYHQDDQTFVTTLIDILNKNGIQTEQNSFCKYPDYKKHAEDILQEYDSIIWILSKNTLDYELLLWYSTAISEIELSEENRKLMIPIFIDVDIQVPDFLSDSARFLIMRDSPKKKYDDLIHTIQINAGQRFFNSSFREKCKFEAIRQLHQAYENKNLTLFCGAGISVGSGIPSWNHLLIRCFLKSSNLTSSYTNVLYDMLSKDLYLNQAILARMVKTSNEKNFCKLVQQALYEDIETDETTTINAIMDLCEPSENGGIKSIVTYNFDDLLECNFEKRNIKYQNRINQYPIAKDHLAIDHVHGFLPRILDEKMSYHVVFSDDEYHEQYSNPYANETLIQLTSLNESTCLYVGISFTDPNMRRLADVSIKHMHCKTMPRHYLIKQKPQSNPDWKHDFLSQKKVLEQIMFLEEMDAESFGFRIIWIDKFNEISQIFSDIKNGDFK